MTARRLLTESSWYSEMGRTAHETRDIHLNRRLGVISATCCPTMQSIDDKEIEMTCSRKLREAYSITLCNS